MFWKLVIFKKMVLICNADYEQLTGMDNPRTGGEGGGGGSKIGVIGMRFHFELWPESSSDLDCLITEVWGRFEGIITFVNC